MTAPATAAEQSAPTDFENAFRREPINADREAGDEDDSSANHEIAAKAGKRARS